MKNKTEKFPHLFFSNSILWICNIILFFHPRILIYTFVCFFFNSLLPPESNFVMGYFCWLRFPPSMERKKERKNSGKPRVKKGTVFPFLFQFHFDIENWVKKGGTCLLFISSLFFFCKNICSFYCFLVK